MMKLSERLFFSLVELFFNKKQMSKNKNRNYKKIGKRILAGASSSILAGMFLMGVTTPLVAEARDYSIPAYTQVSGAVGMHIMHRWNSKAKIKNLATTLGLDANKVKQEIKSGKTLKQVLQENGLQMAELNKAFQNKNSRFSKNWN